MALCQPISDGPVDYSYGKQIGGPESRYSECRIFDKYFPDQSSLPQEGFFCNNANSAIARSAWAQYRFDEEVTSLEDMELEQRMYSDRGRIGYVAADCVYHHHAESWPQVQSRSEEHTSELQSLMTISYDVF